MGDHGTETLPHLLLLNPGEPPPRMRSWRVRWLEGRDRVKTSLVRGLSQPPDHVVETQEDHTWPCPYREGWRAPRRSGDA